MNLLIYVLQQRTLFRIAGILPQQRVHIEVLILPSDWIQKKKPVKDGGRWMNKDLKSSLVRFIIT